METRNDRVRIGSRRYFLILVCMITASIVFVSGCGRRRKPEEEGKILLRYAIFSTPHFTPLEKEIVADFERKNPGIKVNMRILGYGDHNQKIQVELTGGTAPDLWLTDSVFLMEWAERGLLEDLTELWESRMNTQDYVGVEPLRDFNGRLWGIPKELQVSALFYNKDIFDRFGVDYPDDTWTWEDMAKVAKSLTKDTDGDGKTDIFGGPLTSGASSLVVNLIYQNGSTLLDEKRRNSVFNTPQVREAIEFGFSLYRETWPSLAVHAAFGEDYFNVFRQGRAAMFLTHYVHANALKKTMPSLNYSLALPPKKVSRTCFYSPNPFVITKGSSPEVKEAAWKFIEHYSSVEVQKKLGETGEGLPYHREAIAYLMNTEYAKEHNMQVFAQMLDQSVVLDINGCWRQWMDVFYREIEKGLLGITSPEEIPDNLHTKIQKVLDSYYKSE